MDNPLIRKLEIATALNDDDRAVLERMCARRRRLDAKQDIIQQGDRPGDVHLVMEGVTVRYKLMPEGRRHIIAVLLPGDFCDLHVAILGAMDHSIATVTPCTIVEIPAAAIAELTANHPRITHGLWWATLVDEAVLREWLASLGQRDAIKRMAHFFCELLVRLQTVGLADDDGYEMPLRQADLGDIFGLTSVHVNRTLQDLREAGLIALKSRQLTIPDVGRLKAFCAFDPDYLHLSRRVPASLV